MVDTSKELYASADVPQPHGFGRQESGEFALDSGPHKGVSRYLSGETSHKRTSWEFKLLLRITLHWPTSQD
jgi:hypothetical protein